jgi:hypothetical protein
MIHSLAHAGDRAQSYLLRLATDDKSFGLAALIVGTALMLLSITEHNRNEVK